MALNITDIIKDVQRQFDAANAANETRYRQIVGTSDPATGQFTGGLLENMGRMQREDNARRFEGERAKADQDLISSGLTNTTIRSAVRRGLLSDESRAAQNITDSVALQRAQFVERRDDVGPDMGQFAQLVRDAAGSATGRVQSGAGARVSGGGGGGGSFGSGVSLGGVGGGGGSRQGVQSFSAAGRGEAPAATPLNQAVAASRTAQRNPMSQPPYYPGSSFIWRFTDGRWQLIPRSQAGGS